MFCCRLLIIYCYFIHTMLVQYKDNCKKIPINHPKDVWNVKFWAGNLMKDAFELHHKNSRNQQLVSIKTRILHTRVSCSERSGEFCQTSRTLHYKFIMHSLWFYVQIRACFPVSGCCSKHIFHKSVRKAVTWGWMETLSLRYQLKVAVRKTKKGHHELAKDARLAL